MNTKEIQKYSQQIKQSFQQQNIQQLYTILNNLNQLSIKGINTSELLLDIINLFHIDDIELKRLIINYFHLQKDIKEDVILLALNSFHKNLQHQNEYIRSWTIECLSYIENDHFNQVIKEHIFTMLKDHSIVVQLSCLNVLQMKIEMIEEMNKRYEIIKELNEMIFSKHQEISINALNVMIKYYIMIKNQKMKVNQSLLNHLIKISEKCQIIELTKMMSLLKQCQFESSILGERMISHCEKYLESFEISLVIETSELIISICENCIQQTPYTLNVLKRIEMAIIGLYTYHSSNGSSNCCLILNSILSIVESYESIFINQKLLIPEINDSENCVLLKLHCILHCYNCDGLKILFKQIKYLLIDIQTLILIQQSLLEIGFQSKEKALILINSLIELLSIPLRQEIQFVYFTIISEFFISCYIISFHDK